jgi:Sec-independent protein translocase protein TatA
VGFHPLDILVIAAIALLIFGPKTLQSISHHAGRGVGQAKDVKNKILAELPMEDLNAVRETVGKIPLSPQQAARQLLTPAQTSSEKETSTGKEVPGGSVQVPE